MSRFNNDHSLKDLIRELLKSSGMDRKYDELEVVQCYKEVMGSLIATRTRDVRLRDKTLVIKMDSGVLKEELSYSKARIAQLINEKLGSIVVESVEVW